MTIREPTNEGGKIATTRRHPSSNQDLGTDIREIAYDPNVARGSTAKSSIPVASMQSNNCRSKGQESTDDPGSVPVVPSKPKKASVDDEKKQYWKLELAPATSPIYTPTVASRPTEPSLADRDLVLKRQAQDPQLAAAPVVPGAVPVFPKDVSAGAARRDHVETPVTVADNNIAATERDDQVTGTLPLDDAACVHAYVVNDVENGEPRAKEESPKRWSPAVRYGILAGVLVVVALIVALVVVFAVNRQSAAPVAGTSPVASPAKVQYVQYAAVWVVGLSPTFAPTTKVSDLELTCLDGGSLKSPLVTTQIPGILPICSSTGDSIIRCSQNPELQVNSTVVVAAGVNFQCHGTNLDQLVGQASLDTTTIFFGGTSGTKSSATHLLMLGIVDSTTGFSTDDVCSATKIPTPDTTDSSSFTEFCGAADECVIGDGANDCVLNLQGITDTQRAPVASTYIYDA